MRALIIANGARAPRRSLRALARSADLVIAADGGAEAAATARIAPHMLVGDMDSVAPETRAGLAAGGTGIEVVPADKDFTDTEFALQIAIDRGASDVWLATGWGGRMDHAIANLLLLFRARRQHVRLRLLDRYSEAALVDGRATLEARERDLVSLIPLSPVVEGITTQGLRYALTGESLIQGSTRGISNVVVTVPAVVEQTGSGDLLVVHIRNSTSGQV